MIRINSDSSILYKVDEAAKLGVVTTPLHVICGDESWSELEEFSTADCLALIQSGKLPVSSQPSLGEVLANYDKFPNDEIINITMADGLSGTYESACMARDMAANPERITVLNSRTLCGPHRYLVELAAELAAAGESRAAILERLEESMAKTASYLVVEDFDFLRRGGRLSPFVAFIGKTIKMVPSVKASPDGKRLDPFAVKRTFCKALETIALDMQKHGAGSDCKFYVAHAGDVKRGEKGVAAIRKVFGDVELEVLELGPVFVAQGGPGCVSLHFIKK
jgi:DegV family protein with EDD domain